MPGLSLKESPAFREVFLIHAPPRAKAALREVGRLMYLSLLEPGMSDTSRQSLVVDQLRALAADLRFAEGMLGSLRAIRLQSGTPGEAKSICRKAEHWALKISEVAQAIEAALAMDEEAR